LAGVYLGLIRAERATILAEQLQLLTKPSEYVTNYDRVLERLVAKFGKPDNFTRRGNTLYVHVYFWPSGTPAAEWLGFYQPATVVSIGGVEAKVLSAKVLKTGEQIEFTQDKISVRLTGLPATAPDDLVTVLELECDAPPVVDHHSHVPAGHHHGGRDCRHLRH